MMYYRRGVISTGYFLKDLAIVVGEDEYLIRSFKDSLMRPAPKTEYYKLVRAIFEKKREL